MAAFLDKATTSSAQNEAKEIKNEAAASTETAKTELVVGGAPSSTVASRDLLVSTDNQPLLASGEGGVETRTRWSHLKD
ncbi:unnamed protein product [Arabis nemorensis]|uniref:Uncharacterized protein n=1 Tax=Arabis nemorensis TaxID=586526 RepID=A0A565CPZ0_9BRAS|nr:unnamed protein product [Arabis nemorensis]